MEKHDRWGVLDEMFPWAELEKVYYTKFHRDKREAGNKPARMVIVVNDYQAQA
ncbi:hypothetical protein [Prevotella conceptionensis]|uniref:hypothetical protein n=1 Tax=Prevotella conceptionensis TaxID=340486 RepID=UPI0018DC6E7A|nr:hypothetical protein [Prevotella conceptionensis]